MQRSDSGWPLEDVMQKIVDAGEGVIVLLSQKSEQEGVVQRIKNYRLEDEGEPLPGYEAKEDLRTYGVGAQILLSLGVRKMRVMSAPKRLHALSGFGLEVVDYVASDA